MSRRCTKIENMEDLIELPNRYVIRDFYTNVVADGKRKYLIRSFQRGEYVPFENLEALQRRIDDGRIYVRDKPKKEIGILSQEEIDALMDTTHLGKFKDKKLQRMYGGEIKEFKCSMNLGENKNV